MMSLTVFTKKLKTLLNVKELCIWLKSHLKILAQNNITNLNVSCWNTELKMNVELTAHPNAREILVNLTYD